MKIVFVLPGEGKSGGVRSTSVMAKMLRRYGHEVRILYQKPGFFDWCRSIRNRIVYSSAPSFLRQFDGKKDGFQDITKCYFHEEEIIVAVGMVMSAQLARLEEVPNRKLQYIHGATPGSLAIRQKALSMTYPKIVVASFLKEISESYGGGEVLGIIHNGVDCGEYFISVPDSERDGVGVLYSKDPRKGPVSTLSVLDKLSKLRPRVPQRVFGSGRRPKQIESKGYCRFPSVEVAREIYSRSLVWIVASNSEGFSMPVLEAMACGCAVVATDCGGPKDIIRDGENGFLVGVGDVDGIVDRVQLLLRNDTLRKQMQSKALETARNFTWEKSAAELERVLQGLSGSTPD